MADLADLRFYGFLSFEKGETCQSILILLRGKMGSTKTRNPESENGNGIMETETETEYGIKY